MRNIHLLLLLCLLLLAGQASAQTPPIPLPVNPAIPEGADVHQHLPKGAVAPFEGYLFDGPTALRWGNWLTLWKERYRIDMTEAQQVCTSKTTLSAELLAIEQRHNAVVLQAYQKELDLERKKNDRPWYRSFEFGVGVGIVATTAVVLVTGYALKHLD